MGERRVAIGERYCGPPGSGNGGYVCGLVAGILGEPAEVTLRRPPPIGRPLLARRTTERGVVLLDEEHVVVEAFPSRVDVEPPGPVSLQEAVQAARRYPGFDLHPFPNCFVCGPERAEGDGLRIFPGPVTGRQVFAAPWTPDPSLAGPDGLVRKEFVWAALDCPGAFASGFPEPPMVLGRLAAHVLAPIQPGEECVAVAWSERVDGRKHFAGTALFTSDGGLVAVARAVWIRIVPAAS